MKPRLKAIPGHRSDQTSRETVLSISELRKVFGGKGAFHTVLSDVNLHVKAGELACIIGRSGCGKSTLLKILAGFLPPSSGKSCSTIDPFQVRGLIAAWFSRRIPSFHGSRFAKTSPLD